ncbi:hypothetical protein SAMN04488054_11845 [Salibacterium qingdaonense]|uniref:Uncharacterized protein n=1 Tax=Salibacterium qingdaonense TaxID=266892 RepID=A0A1I4NJ19_9BACI|nr:hypothetical protein SAMN04488054_11845 [Salibacterium qingdaonense]
MRRLVVIRRYVLSVIGIVMMLFSASKGLCSGYHYHNGGDSSSSDSSSGSSEQEPAGSNHTNAGKVDDLEEEIATLEERLSSSQEKIEARDEKIEALEAVVAVITVLNVEKLQEEINTVKLEKDALDQGSGI